MQDQDGPPPRKPSRMRYYSQQHRFYVGVARRITSEKKGSTNPHPPRRRLVYLFFDPTGYIPALRHHCIAFCCSCPTSVVSMGQMFCDSWLRNNPVLAQPGEVSSGKLLRIDAVVGTSSAQLDGA